MSPTGTILLFLYLIIGPAVIATARGVRGVVLAVAIGWLILSPRVGVNLPGIPQYTKDYAVSYAVIIGFLLFHSSFFSRIRFNWIDSIFVFFLASPMASSLSNGLGPWDAASELYGRLFTWGVFYIVGRCLVSSIEDVRECALAIILAGIIMVPFCLIEIRLSPQLHRWVYGFYQQPFHMSIRLGGYRPILMFRHGIEVGSWLACSSIVAFWFALVNPKLRAFFVPVTAQAAILVCTSLLSRSLGALALLAGSASTAIISRYTRSKLLLHGIVLAVPGYLMLRIAGLWRPDFLIATVENFVDPVRAKSFGARLLQEGILSERAKERILFGWGGHNRFRVVDEFGQSTTAVDALWLITFGKYGLFGLVSLYGLLCIPSIVIIWKTPAKYLLHPKMAGVVGLILALFIANADSLQNAFYSPLMMISAGVLATTAVSLRDWLPKPGSRPLPPQPQQPSPSDGSDTLPMKE